jgi:hypothetical protein
MNWTDTLKLIFQNKKDIKKGAIVDTSFAF